MSTIGKRFVDRTHDRSGQRIIDARTKAVLSAVIAEPPGKDILSCHLDRPGNSRKPGPLTRSLST